MRKIFFFIFIVKLPCYSQQINLNKNWQFSQHNSSIWKTAKIPGSVYSDLRLNHLIPNPFFGNNENKLKWIDDTSWDYRTTFFIDADTWSKNNIDIHFEGLDTYADVYLNDNFLFHADNMFKEWTYPLKEKLNKGRNNLSIHFLSAKKTTDSIADLNLPLIRPDNNRVYARKAQFQFGWDWGPAFINAGIYKNIWLDAYNQTSAASIIQTKRDELNAKRKKNIRLIQHPDSIGTSFYFEKDGLPIYMKGANWIPADIFLTNVNKSTYRRLLQNAKEANMNMLRVWGGGIYENDEFYDLCDSMGIYVWQDFMFACGMYPSDKHFLQNVKDEVFQQISRLRHHPCILVWCGNNEIDEAWHNWGWQTQYNLHDQDSIKIWRDYQTLFKDSLLAWVNQFDGTRPYITTSPKNGWGHPESFIEGDSHYWGLWWGLEDWEIFKTKTGRFVSEYGMQSMPNYSTVKTYTNDSSRYLFAPAILSHQKASEGFKKLNYYLTRYFIDSSILARINLIDYCYITQCMQAFILQNSISTHMNNYPKNMGTLLWQLNDCWPVTSWSIIDYEGGKKAAWYAVKRAYADNANHGIISINRQTLIENQPKFTVKINDEHSISIRSSCDAQFVYIEGYDLSDNFFDLKKGETKIVGLKNTSVSNHLINQLKIYSLNQFYYQNNSK